MAASLEAMASTIIQGELPELCCQQKEEKCAKCCIHILSCYYYYLVVKFWDLRSVKSDDVQVMILGKNARQLVQQIIGKCDNQDESRELLLKALEYQFCVDQKLLQLTGLKELEDLFNSIVTDELQFLENFEPEKNDEKTKEFLTTMCYINLRMNEMIKYFVLQCYQDVPLLMNILEINLNVELKIAKLLVYDELILHCKYLYNNLLPFINGHFNKYEEKPDIFVLLMKHIQECLKNLAEVIKRHYLGSFQGVFADEFMKARNLVDKILAKTGYSQ